MKIVDLSHIIDDKCPHFPGDNGLTLKQIKYLKQDYYNDHFLSCNMHLGTHIDSPMHLTTSTKYINEYPLDFFITKGMLIDARGEQVIPYKKEYESMIKENMSVLIHTGHSQYFYKDNYYKDYPVLSEELVELLIKKKIRFLGVDTPSPDDIPYTLHRRLLEHGIFIIENLTHMEELMDKNFSLYAIPLNIKADSSISRVFAQINE